jgi:hypothetical protein
VRGEAEFGSAVHVAAADLDFDPHILCASRVVCSER